MTSSKVKQIFGVAVALLCTSSHQVKAQAIYTASRAGDLQVGGGLALGASQYLPVDAEPNSAPLSDLTRRVHLLGGSAYASFDMRDHLGVQLDFLRLKATDDTSKQTSVEAAGRYVITRRLGMIPYLKAGFGHGWYGYPNDLATIGYNLYGLGGGADYHLTHSINIRAAYEYQGWLSVPLKNPKPQVITIGVAYHFHER